MDTKKTVSVVMATYNGEEYIREQIESIVAQTYPIYELIIQDDCSTDSTVAICREYAERYPFIRVFVNESNKGFNDNFKTVALRATGDLVAVSDQDDIWFPEKIEKQVAAIADYTMCYSQHLRGEDMEHARLVDYKNAPERHIFKAVVGHSMLLDGDFVRDEATWPGGLAYDIWLTALANFRKGVVRIAEPLNFHRSHTGQASVADGNSNSVWKPYVYGFSEYRRLQRSEGWKMFYQRLLEESNGKNALVHNMCRLLLSRSIFSLLRLCFICHKHRSTIYPSDRTGGIMGHVRSFCYPLIQAYYGSDFYRVR